MSPLDYQATREAYINYVREQLGPAMRIQSKVDFWQWIVVSIRLFSKQYSNFGDTDKKQTLWTRRPTFPIAKDINDLRSVSE